MLYPKHLLTDYTILTVLFLLVFLFLKGAPFCDEDRGGEV